MIASPLFRTAQRPLLSAGFQLALALALPLPAQTVRYAGVTTLVAGTGNLAAASHLAVDDQGNLYILNDGLPSGEPPQSLCWLPPGAERPRSLGIDPFLLSGKANPISGIATDGAGTLYAGGSTGSGGLRILSYAGVIPSDPTSSFTPQYSNSFRPFTADTDGNLAGWFPDSGNPAGRGFLGKLVSSERFPTNLSGTVDLECTALARGPKPGEFYLALAGNTSQGPVRTIVQAQWSGSGVTPVYQAVPEQSISALAVDQDRNLLLVAAGQDGVPRVLLETPRGTTPQSYARTVLASGPQPGFGGLAVDGNGHAYYEQSFGAAGVYRVAYQAAEFGLATASRPALRSLSFTLEAGVVLAPYPACVRISGDQAEDFSCGDPSPAKAPGQWSLPMTFTPHGTGQRSAQLTLLDNQGNPLVQIPLKGTAIEQGPKAGLGLMPAAGSPWTLAPGGTGSTQVSLTALGTPGTSPGPVELDVQGVPTGVIVTLSPYPLAALPASVTLTARYPSAPAVAAGHRLPGGPGGAGAFLACGILALPWARRRRFAGLLLTGLALVLAAGLGGCSGSGPGGTVGAVPPGTYPVIRTAQAPGMAPASVVLPLVVR
jgi:hypothetical protein